MYTIEQNDRDAFMRSQDVDSQDGDVRVNHDVSLTVHPFVGSPPPEPIDMPFMVLSGVPDIITHAKFYVNRLRGFSAVAPRKVPFPILFRTTLTTVLHYRADCDMSNHHVCQPEYVVQSTDEPEVTFKANLNPLVKEIVPSSAPDVV